MKILMHAPEKSACTYYRNTLPIMHCYRDLAVAGVELASQHEILDIDMADVYIFERVIPDAFLPHLMKLKESGAKLVFQTDDDLWSIPSWNPANGKLSYNDKQATTVALDLVDEIIASTDPLAQMMNKKSKTTVLPNLIDTSCYHPRPSQFDQFRLHKNQVRILWAGSNSHDGDLEQIVNPVLRLIQKYKNRIQFFFFGYLPTGLADFVRFASAEVACLKPKHEGNIVYIPPCPLRVYHDVIMAMKADIGIAPLADCMFNFSKSNIKSLEMTMTGAAFVGTNLPPYGWITNDETGKLVAPGNEDGWFDVLDELIQDQEKRKKLQANAKEEILSRFTWQSPSRNLWLDKLKSLGGV